MTIATSTITYENHTYSGEQDDWLYDQYSYDAQGKLQVAKHPDAWLFYTPSREPESYPDWRENIPTWQAEINTQEQAELINF